MLNIFLEKKLVHLFHNSILYAWYESLYLQQYHPVFIAGICK